MNDIWNRLAMRPRPATFSRVHSCHFHSVIQISPILSFFSLLQAQKPEQSVMQALESLNDSQVRLTASIV